MWKRVQKRTVLFVGFILSFFALLLFLTYYSNVSYFERLPRVMTVMPERTEEYKNGRYLYNIPKQAVQRDEDSGKLFIYTAREYRDILGERNLVTRLLIRIENELENDRVLVDGILREEPIITKEQELLYEGQAVLLKETN